MKGEASAAPDAAERALFRVFLQKGVMAGLGLGGKEENLNVELRDKSEQLPQ